MSLGSIISACEIGLIFSIMSLGIYITFKILDFPDLSVDGSFSLGAVCSSVLVINNHPILGLIIALLAGSLAGFTTAFLHTKMKIQYILAGIITMSSLYSINLRIAGNKPNIPLLGNKTIFSLFNDFITNKLSLKNSFLSTYSNLILLIVIVLILVLLLTLFFKTQFGLAIRATGNNEAMVRASSINTDLMKIVALMMANSLVGLSAAIFSQHQRFYDISQGIGMMIIGLTSIIIGEAIFGKRSILNSFIALVLGAILYRILVAITLQLGMPANDLKLLSALLVTITISLPIVKQMFKKRGGFKSVRN